MQTVVGRVRAVVLRVETDRYMAPSLEAAAALVADGALLDGLPSFVLGDA